MISYHKMQYVMIKHDTLWWHVVHFLLFICFFQNCLAIIGTWLGIMTGHFEPLKKCKSICIFSKVVYWPLGYYFLSSLTFCRLEIFFWNSQKMFFNKYVSHTYLWCSSIFNDKQHWKITENRPNKSYMRGPILEGP